MSKHERERGECPVCIRKPFPEKVTLVSSTHEHGTDCCNDFHDRKNIYQCSTCKTVWSDPY